VLIARFEIRRILECGIVLSPVQLSQVKVDVGVIVANWDMQDELERVLCTSARARHLLNLRSHLK
jgi:hypothetical protein